MACFYPLRAFKTFAGDVVFYEHKRFDIVQSLWLPCGQCSGCRLERSRQWAMRCVHEASLHTFNSFVTLTYDEAHLPADGSLNYEHYQAFMKRLIYHLGPVRFYMCGEYGELNWRPHYHACLFGITFSDRESLGKTGSGFEIFRSAQLERIWGHGLCSFGDVTFESAAYCARYCMHKRTGPDADEHYRRFNPLVEELRMDMSTGELYSHQLVPEFSHMSLKPGIGAAWYEKWSADVFPHDYVVVNGKEVKPPRYYDNLLSREIPEEFDEVKFRRESTGRAMYLDNTEARLAVRERVLNARISLLKRDSI